MEVWKAVVGYEGYYEVSDLGAVRTVEREQQSYGGRAWVKPVETRKATFDGRYMVMTLAKEGTRKRFYIHDIVLTAFRGARPTSKTHGCHNDGDSKNNSLQNLRWDTPTANVLDKVKHGTMPIGERHHKNRYSEETMRAVVAMLDESRAMAEIERLTGVPANTISQVKHGRQWKHLRQAEK